MKISDAVCVSGSAMKTKKVRRAAHEYRIQANDY